MQLHELLKKADIYISMPETEGVSASLFEAMACGCFPIVADLPANRAIIMDGETGLLVAVDDKDELFEKLKQAINSPSLLSDARRKNCEYVKANADLQNNMQAFVKKYTELLLENK